MDATDFNVSIDPAPGESEPPQLFVAAVRMPDGSIKLIGPASLAECFEQIALARGWALDWLKAKRLAEEFRQEQRAEREKQIEQKRAKSRDRDRGPT